MTRLLITGSRICHPHVERKLSGYVAKYGKPEWLVLGCAAGVDRQALLWACEHDVFFVVHTADWERYQFSGGPMRNRAMVACAGFGSRAMAFPRGRSHGTRGCVGLCEAAGIPTRVFEFEEER